MKALDLDEISFFWSGGWRRAELVPQPWIAETRAELKLSFRPIFPSENLAEYHHSQMELSVDKKYSAIGRSM